MSAGHDWDELWEDGLLVRLICARCGSSIAPFVLIVPSAEADEVKARIGPGREVWGMSHLPPGHREFMYGRVLAGITGKPPCVRREIEDGS